MAKAPKPIGKADIATKDGKKAVDLFFTGRGLLVTKGPASSCYTITHANSGYAISGYGGFDTLTGAKAAVKRLLALPIDWTQDKASLEAAFKISINKDVKQAVAESFYSA